MALSRADLKALAAELAPLLARELRAADERQTDAEYLATLPHQERQRIQREKRRRQVEAEKKRKGANQ